MVRWWALLGLAVAAIVSSEPAGAQTKVTITSSSESLFHVPIYIAQELGYFKELGLQVETIPTNSGPRSIAAVLSGEIDMVMGAPANPITARKAGADMVLFAGTATQYGANVVASKKWADAHKLAVGSPFKDKLAALKDASVAVTGPGGGNEQIVRYLAAEAGINPDREMTLVPLGEMPAMLAAFSVGRVDLISAAPPNSHVAIHDFGGVMMFNLGAGEVQSLAGYLGSGVAARGDWLKKNATVATNFVKALQMGYDAMRDPARTEQVRDVVYKARYAQIDRGLFAELWVDTVAGAPKTPAVTRENVQKLVDFTNRFAREKIDAALIDGSFTNEYVERALTEMKR